MSSGIMRMIRVEKIVVNIGAGDGGERLIKTERVLEMLTGKKPIRTYSRTTNKDLGIRKGQPIGCKITLRRKEAEEFIAKALWTKNNQIAGYSFDLEGNFSFGVADHTDFKGMKYDPDIGVFGMDVCVSLARAGKRVSQRRIAPRRIPKRHRITQSEGKEYVKHKFKVEVVE